MTSTSLTFLLSDGLREKVTLESAASRPVAAFFEALCARRGLDVRRFEVVTKGAKGRMQRVDLSLPLRLSGFSPSTLLELAPIGGAGAGAGAEHAGAGGGGGGGG